MTALFIGFCAGFTLLLALLNLAMNRWKFDLRNFWFMMGYGLATGIPVAFASMFSGKVDKLVYGIIAVLVIAPFILLETVSIVKRRNSPLRSAAGIAGIVLMMSTPLMEPSRGWINVLVGASCMGLFMVFHFRYPALNPMWLGALVREAARSVPSGCGYSPKPITVFVENGGNFWGGSYGFSVYARKDRTTMWMKRKLHERLGAPNLELLAREIATRLRGEGAGRRSKA